jgi:hypothetical protein
VKKHLDHVHAEVETPARGRAAAHALALERAAAHALALERAAGPPYALRYQTVPRIARSRSPSCTVADPPTGST